MVHAVLQDYQSAPISDQEKALFKFVEKLNATPNSVSRSDIEEAQRAGWSEEALYDAITVCALFNFYNRWIDGTGVQDMPPHGYEASRRRMAADGYIHDMKK